jgi:hypothetical protein
MKDLAAFLLVVGVLLLAAVHVVRWAFPSQPALVIDATPAAAPARPAGPLVLILPPRFAGAVWCSPPANARPKGAISRT